MKLRCSCGAKTNKLRYISGKTVCDACTSVKLSGNWLTRAEGDKKHYAKDILQRYNKDGSRNQDFIEAYGEEPYHENETHDYLKR